MLRDHMRKRTVALFSSVPVDNTKSGTRHTLGFKIKVELDVYREAFPAVEQDFYDICLNHIKQGNIMAMLEYLEPLTGTQQTMRLAQKIRKHIGDYTA